MSDHYREILERESSARLALKRERANIFRGVMTTEKMTVALARAVVATLPDVQQLEDEYERAHIDLLVERYAHGIDAKDEPLSDAEDTA